MPGYSLHGWPYDIYSFVDAVPALVAAGHRVIVPYLRGYGTTRFLSTDTVRNGQPAALARGAVDLLDALKIQKAVIAGFGWGRTHGRHRGGSVARALHSSRVSQWLSDNPDDVDIVILLDITDWRAP